MNLLGNLQAAFYQDAITQIPTIPLIPKQQPVRQGKSNNSASDYIFKKILLKKRKKQEEILKLYSVPGNYCKFRGKSMTGGSRNVHLTPPK